MTGTDPFTIEEFARFLRVRSAEATRSVLDDCLAVGYAENVGPDTYRLTHAGVIKFKLEPPTSVQVDLTKASQARKDWPGRLRLDIDGLPMPTLLLGECKTWDNRAHESCPHCGGKPLGPNAYCVYCDRWGLDFLSWE